MRDRELCRRVSTQVAPNLALRTCVDELGSFQHLGEPRAHFLAIAPLEILLPDRSGEGDVQILRHHVVELFVPVRNQRPQALEVALLLVRYTLQIPV